MFDACKLSAWQQTWLTTIYALDAIMYQITFSKNIIVVRSRLFRFKIFPVTICHILANQFVQVHLFYVTVKSGRNRTFFMEQESVELLKGLFRKLKTVRVWASLTHSHRKALRFAIHSKHLWISKEHWKQTFELNWFYYIASYCV